ncbi:MAG: hypothetical protein VKO21_11875 [Candidatus Sericytochromatia bacterium]|nr:hypothetical protein [Candidatus Sericytochromatia bacterium]
MKRLFPEAGARIPAWMAVVAFVASGVGVLWGTWVLTTPSAVPSQARDAWDRAARAWVGQAFPRVVLPSASAGKVALPLPGPQVLVFFRVFT